MSLDPALTGLPDGVDPAALLASLPDTVILLDPMGTITGFGASGRNGGWCSAIFPISLSHVAKATSRGSAVRLQAEMNHTVREVGRVVSTEGVDCDFAHEGFVSLARSPAHLVRARAARDAAAVFGLRIV